MTGQEKHYVKASLQTEDGKYVVRARVYDPQTGKIRQRSKTTGLTIKGNKRKAEEMMRQFVADWEREANAEVVCADPLFSQCLDLWIEHKAATLRESTVKAYEYNINKHILPRLGKRHVRDITLYDIRGFYDDLKKSGLKANTIKKIHLIVSGVLEDAVNVGIIPFNPAKRVKLPKVERFEGQPLTITQVSQLLNAAKQEGEPMQAVIILALCYGLRRSEALGLRWCDIDFEKNTLHVCNTVVENGGQIWELEATKTVKSNRVLDLGNYCVPYLKALKQAQENAAIVLDKVCCWPDGSPVMPSYVTHRYQKIANSLGLSTTRLHDLRHTAATLASKEVAPNLVQSFLGHENISTTYNIYVHTNSEDSKRLSNVMDGILQNAELCSESCSENCSESNIDGV